MDSGNSGSMQSSSGDSEEYDSHSESISAFLDNNASSHIGHGDLVNQPPQLPSPPPQHQQYQNHSLSAMFDPLSNYFDQRSQHLTTNPNPLGNLDAVWSKNLSSESGSPGFGGFVASSSPTQQQLTNTNQQAQSRATFPSVQIPQGPDSDTRSSVSGVRVRNSKKRSRASRRAPTTVLTTDTTNFRAMVQEFTGIPAPPFASSAFPRTRLDIFAGTPSSTLRSIHLDPSTSHYLLRPFAPQIHPPSFVSSSVASTPITNITSASATNDSTTSSSTPINYQLPSQSGLLKQPQNLLNINMQNPVLNFQPLLGNPQKYPLPSSTIQGCLDIPSNGTPLKMGVLEDEFGLSQGHVNTDLNGVQNMASSEGALPRNERRGFQKHDQSLPGSINGSYNSNSHRVSNGKVESLSSSSDFNGDKGPEENVATRSEGIYILLKNIEGDVA